MNIKGGFYMLNEVIKLLPILLVVMGLNNLCGIYKKIGIEGISFDWRVFINGIIKTAIVFIGLIGIAYACDNVDFLDIENTPVIIIKGAIVAYGAKVSAYLYKIVNANVSDTEYIDEDLG